MFDFTWILRLLGGSLATIILTFGGCLTALTSTGCSTLTPEQVQTQQAIMESWTQFAKENGVQMVAQAGYNGRGELFQQSSIGIGTGITAQATFFFDPSKAIKPVQ